jgi:PEP-CTERM motif
MKDMQMKRILMSGAALAVALMGAVPAQAITYIGTRTVGAGTAQLSITTDNSLGVLSAANITDWTIDISAGGSTVSLLGPLSGSNSAVTINGSGLTATATDLIFSFDNDGYLLFKLPGLFAPAYCVDGASAAPTCIGSPGSENIFVGGLAQVTLDGSTILATAQGPGGVPEPEAWALMIAGFGLVGAAMRRRAAVQVTYA